MKLILIVAALFSAQAFAKLVPELPRALSCTSAAQNKDVQSFEITEVGSEEPQSNIPDTSYLDFKTNGSITQFSFSNECDNSYDFVFFTNDLHELSAGTVTSVNGFLRYYTADPLNEALLVTCTLK